MSPCDHSASLKDCWDGPSILFPSMQFLYQSLLAIPSLPVENRLLIYALGVSGVSLIVIIAVALFQIFTIDISVPSSDNGLLPIVVNAISGVLAMGFTVAGMSAILLLRHWILYNQRVDEIQSATLHSELKFLKTR